MFDAGGMAADAVQSLVVVVPEQGVLLELGWGPQVTVTGSRIAGTGC